MRRLARIVARTLARNVTCGSAFSTFFVLVLSKGALKRIRDQLKSIERFSD